MRPILIKEIRNEHGDLIARNEPVIDTQVVSPETARKVVKIMETVTQPGGTGRAAQIPGYRVAGKTGTAQKADPKGGYSEKDRIGSWIGLVPAEDPKLAIVVIIDTPTLGDSYGGVVAAPAFAEIASHSLRILGIMPDPSLLPPPSVDPAELEEGVPYFMAQEIKATPHVPPDLAWTQEGSFRTPDLTGLSLRDTFAVLQGAGLSIHTTGTGRVISQDPMVGSSIRPGEQVGVVLQ
jgi:cell division protein FtsI (penicillin-binding protein 3)